MAAASIEDWFRINNLFTRYATALDHSDVESVADCFTENGTIESPILGTFVGRSGILDFAERSAKVMQGGRAQFRHVVANLRVDVDGDRARATCYLLDFLTRDGVTTLLSPGEYDCRLVRVGDDWRFEYRLVVMDHPFSV